MSKDARSGLVAAARGLFVAQGYADTSVDEICARAGVSKGAFFHHFANKEAIVRAAVDDFADELVAWQAEAPGADDPDPLRRAFAFVDHNIRFVEETPPEPFGCLLGSVAVELTETHPALRDASAEGLRRWTAALTTDLAEAAKTRRLDVDAAALATHFSHAFQGGVVLGRATNDPRALVESLRHYRRYLEMTFTPRA